MDTIAQPQRFITVPEDWDVPDNRLSPDDALLNAVQGNEPDVITRAIAAGADVNLRDEGEFGGTPLHRASRNSHHEAVVALLQGGADPDRVDRFGRTSLHIAAVGNHSEVVQSLLEGGANPNVADRNGTTPLHQARYADVVDRLLDYGANPDERDQEGWTPLHVRANEGDPGALQRLIGRGADVNARDDHGNTPLRIAANPSVWYEETAGLLVRAGGTDPKAVHEALHEAARYGRPTLVQQAIDAGADVNARDDYKGDTALHLAADAAEHNSVQHLLDAGANPDLQNK